MNRWHAPWMRARIGLPGPSCSDTLIGPRSALDHADRALRPASSATGCSQSTADTYARRLSASPPLQTLSAARGAGISFRRSPWRTHAAVRDRSVTGRRRAGWSASAAASGTPTSRRPVARSLARRNRTARSRTGRPRPHRAASAWRSAAGGLCESSNGLVESSQLAPSAGATEQSVWILRCPPQRPLVTIERRRAQTLCK